MEMSVEQKRALAMANARLRLKNKSTENDEPISMLDAFVGPVMSAARLFSGVQRGAEDPIDAGAQMLANAAPEGFTQKARSVFGEKFVPTGQEFNEQQAQEERAYQAKRKAMGDDGVDIPRLAGQALTLAPAMAVAPGPGATMMSTALRGAGTGAALGSTMPVTNTETPFWEQKGKQSAIGAASGAVAAPVIQAIGKALSPQVDKGVKYLMDRGVKPRPGQIMGRGAAAIEDKAQSIPIVGDAIADSQRRAIDSFNRAAYNEVLKPIGKKYSGPVGREGIGAVKKMISDAYDNVLPKIQFKSDQKFISDFTTTARMAQNLPPDKYNQFKSIMEKELVPRFSKTGQMDGTTFKAMESELSRFARQYSFSGSPDDRQLANAVQEVLKSARTALERSNPKLAPQLRKINQASASFMRVRSAATALGTDEGVFTPAQLLNAVKAGDKSAGKGSFARGDALMQTLAEKGRSVLGSKYPDSGTAGRLANIGGAAALVTAPVPTVTGATLGSLPYTQTGQKAVTSLLASRPAWSLPLRRLIERGAVPGGGLLGVGLTGQPVP